MVTLICPAIKLLKKKKKNKQLKVQLSFGERFFKAAFTALIDRSCAAYENAVQSISTPHVMQVLRSLIRQLLDNGALFSFSLYWSPC